MRRMLNRISTCLAIAVLLLPVLSAQQSVKGQRVTRLNNEILDVYTRSVRAGGERPGLRQQAQQLLQQREEALADLASDSPREALASALPADLAGDLARAFPESASRVERHGSLIGVLEVEVEDGEDLQEHKVIRHIRVGRDRFRVHFSGDALEAESGSLVQLDGMLVGESMVAESADLTSADAAAQSCSTTGVQKMAVIKVRPAGAAASLANSTLDNWMFGSSGMTVNNWWQENSGGAAWADGDVYPSGADAWYTLDREYSCSESSALRDAAMDLADGDVNYNNYQRVVIVFPKPSSGCSFAGRASIGCWVSSPDGNTVSYALQVLTSMGSAQKTVQLTTHEGGHTLGLSHASTADYGSEPLGPTNSSGTKAEYGDRYSSMGFWTDGHYAAPHKDRLGWITSQSVSSNGSFVIKPFSSATGTTALKIKRGSTGSQNLWLEYRRQLGQFKAGPPDSPTNGALIHLSGSSNSLLLDFTPGTKTGGSTTPNDFLDAPLKSGQTWEDPYSDLAIEIGAATNSGLTVIVSYGGTPTCSTNPPTINVSPSSKSVTYPAATSYTVSVTNNDSSACSSSPFTMTADALFNSQSTSEVNATLGNAVLTIAPGSSGSTTLTATPSTLPAQARNYVVSARAARTSPAQAVEDTAGFTVVPPLQCVVGLPSVGISPVSRSAEYPTAVSYTVTVGNTDNSACSNSSFALNAAALLNGQPTGAVNPVLSVSSLTIAPGASKAATVTVTPTQQPTANTNYQIAASAGRSNPSQSVSDQSTFTVIAPAVCSPGLPTVSLNPTGRTTEFPAPASYTLTVVNNDDNVCTASSFAVTHSGAGGISTTVSSPSLSIAPGATKTVTVVATPSSLPSQTTTYAVSAGVSRANPSQSVGDESQLTVVPPAVCAPNLPTLSVGPASQSSNYPNPVTYAVTLTNNDSAVCESSTFALSSGALLNGTPTAEVSAAVSGAAMTIAPGASKSTTIVATPATLPPAIRNYTVNTQASRSGQAGVAQKSVGLTVVPPAICAVNLPTVVVSPVSQSAQFPNPVSYLVKLTNNDSEACTSSTFSLTSGALLGGFATAEVSTGIGSSTLTLAPGASANTSVTATPLTLPEQSRSYLVAASANRSNQASPASSTAGFTVVPPVINPPPPPPPSSETATIQITVLGSRGSSVVSPLGINCSDDCTITLNESEWQQLTLQAVPSGQSCVQAIRGCEVTGGNSCALASGISYDIEVEFARCTRGGGGGSKGKGRVKRLAETTDSTSTGRGRTR
jgi:M6 family metalloprotease-like protein